MGGFTRSCSIGAFFLIGALVLLIITSISLPFLRGLDFTRVTFDGTSIGAASDAVNQVRFGIWSACMYKVSDGSRICSDTGHGYIVGLRNPTTSEIIIVGASWTRGLAIHPVAAGVTFLAAVCAFSTHATGTLLASVLSFLAAFITLIAFCVDIALLAFTRHQMNKLPGSHTNTAAGFWLTFVSLILLLIAGCTVFFGRRGSRAGDSSSSYSSGGSLWTRIRRKVGY